MVPHKKTDYKLLGLMALTNCSFFIWQWESGGEGKLLTKKVSINKYRRNEKNRKSLGEQLLQVRPTEVANISE